MWKGQSDAYCIDAPAMPARVGGDGAAPLFLRRTGVGGI